MTEHLQEISSFPAIQRLIEENKKFNTELLRTFQRIQASHVEVLQRISEISAWHVKAIQRISEISASYVKAIQRIRGPDVEALMRHIRFVSSVEETGWLPYHTVPIDYVDESKGNTSEFETHLSNFYQENWRFIRQDIESRLGRYHISEETKSTFREALSAHEDGYYRCVCRVLFPDIEREFRIRFFENQTRSIKPEKMLEKLTNLGSLEHFMPRHAYGLILFRRLINHLYEQIKDNNKADFEHDFLPNRHASAHGLISYSTHKHSMNMIIMADYIFQILTSTTDLPSPQ